MYGYLENIRMGNAHKVTHDEETSSEIIKQKQQIEFIHNDFIREIEGDLEDEYQILSPALEVNDFYQLRKIIYKRTRLCRAAIIINKYKVRSQQRELLEQQISKLKRIDNPYLLKIYELYYDKHRFYIICELCTGQSLAQILAEEGPLSERKAARVMHQLLSVLADCHRNGIMHTDLKLENIMFNSKKEEIIKITDFSISRIFRIEDVIDQSRRKAFIAAPEMLRDDPGPKSDVWSCGIVLYIILTGEIPIYGTTKRRLLQRMSCYQPNFNIDKFKFISKQAKNLLRSMLQQAHHSRHSAEQCLAHPWFGKFYQPTKISDSTFKRILDQCFNFNPSSKLQQATWGFYVNSFISFDEKQSILHTFALLDEQAKNYLTQDDLYAGFRKFYGQKKSRFFADFIYRRHNMKPIKFSEFITISTNRTFLINSENNKNLFNIIDDDGSGEITVSELKAVLGASKEISEEIWLELMKEADENSDGVISFEEFTHMMNGLQNKNNQKFLSQLDGSFEDE